MPPTQKFKLLLVATFATVGLLLSTSARMQTGTVAPQTASQKFKNIKALNDMPAEQLGKVMNLMGASLGVGCSYCHVGYEFPKDDNPKKEVARRMLRMTFALNRDNFGGRPVISCNTCHNGSTEPNPRPRLDGHAESDRPTPPATKLPTATAIIDRYERALGTPEARARIRSRYMTATRIEPDGSSEKEEIWQLTPDKLLIKTTYPPKYVIAEGFDGTQAWKASNGEKIELKADEIEQIRQNALVGNLELSRIFAKIEYGYRTVIEGRCADVLLAESGNDFRNELIFDCATGLLVRRESASRTILGDFVVRVDYADYRSFDGVKIPTTINFAMPGVRWTRKIATVTASPNIVQADFDFPPARK